MSFTKKAKIAQKISPMSHLPKSLVCSSAVLVGQTPRPVALCSHTGWTRSATLFVGVGLSLAVLQGEPAFALLCY